VFQLDSFSTVILGGTWWSGMVHAESSDQNINTKVAGGGEDMRPGSRRSFWFAVVVSEKAALCSAFLCETRVLNLTATHSAFQ
jgi:hypothetical protein